MTNRLVPCVGCSRHFRVSEAACPFCGSASSESVESARPIPKLEGRPLTRAALLFATATTAASAMACGKSPAEPDKMLVQPYGVPVTPPTGLPTPDAGPSDPSATDAGAKPKPTLPPTNAAPAYGVPPPRQ
ncbi:MAG: hypothetical protein JST00_44675 [Deltaproteobacteria bacterium]|nr:hypothetical protein [Deltaproteobacteria bacterium]